MTFNIMALSIMAFSIMAFSIKHSDNDDKHNDI
jgi:hypothetical protein